jgi:glutamate:GABA antiporter
VAFQPDGRPRATHPELPRVLGLRDVVAMNVVAVVALRWITRGARMGAPSLALWVLAWLAFFLPLAFAVSGLSRRFPEQGGIYAWTRRAFGRRHGFVCGWCLWINNLFYFPSLLLFAATNASAVMVGPAAAAHENRAWSVGFVLVVLWLSTSINVVGFTVSKWVQNLGSVGTWLPAAVLIGCGGLAFWRFGSATSFAPAAMIPRGDALDTLAAWSAICFAFSGFEVTAMVGEEVQRPARTIPLGIVLAGLVATAIYVAGSASVLVAIPGDALSERSGIAEAIDLVAVRIGLGGLGAITAALLAVGAVAQTNSWVAAAARVPFAAAMDHTLPAFFARLHPRHKTPHVALIVQAAAASAILLVSLFLGVGSAAVSVQEGYDVLVNLTILTYFVPYLYLFVAYLRLDRRAGGHALTWLVALTGLASTSISIVLLFVPPAGTPSPLTFYLSLIGQFLALVGAGLLLARRGWRDRPATLLDT